VYYDLEEPIQRRPVWPWLAALLFVIGAGIGGWFLYSQISSKLNSTKPVAVEEYRNMPEQLAREKIKADGFVPVVNHHASRTTASGLVFRQSTPAGKRLPKQSEITIWVSTGLPKAVVPGLVGTSSTDAVARLTKLGLKPDLHQVPSSSAVGTVLAQDPPADTKVTVGGKVRLNVSKGPQPVSVPSVIGEPIDQASSELQAVGFNVSPRYVDDNQPKNTVIGQDPVGGGSAGKGSTVKLTVSNGPKTSTVPAGFADGTGRRRGLSPSFVSAATASVELVPTRSGTSAFGRPVETQIVTSLPFAIRLPASGFCLNTSPNGVVRLAW